MDQNNRKRKQTVLISTISIILLVALIIGVIALIIATSLKSDDDITLREGSYRMQTLESGQSCPFDTFTLTVQSVALDDDMFGEAPVRLSVELSEGNSAEVKVKESEQGVLALTLTTTSGVYEFSGKLKSEGSKIAVTLQGGTTSYSFTLAHQK